MALNSFSVPGKLLQLQDGVKYAYVHVPAKESKSTFLFLHGFPSSSYDWRHQLTTLPSHGYGVLVPDLLGYGDTDKPTEPEAYNNKRMAGHIAEILTEEAVKNVIAVGHDWGSGLLSSLVNYYQSRLSAVIFTSVSYIEPGTFSLEESNTLTAQAFGYTTFGYWYFFNSEDAGQICDQHHDSLTSLVYPADPKLWITDLAPRGAARAFVTANIIKPRPQWISELEDRTHAEILTKGGYTAPLNWYKATVRGLNAEDEALVAEEDKFVNVPALVVVSDEDFITRADVAEQMSSARLRDYSIKTIKGCGHWIQLEKKDEYTQLLIDFADAHFK